MERYDVAMNDEMVRMHGFGTAQVIDTPVGELRKIALDRIRDGYAWQRDMPPPSRPLTREEADRILDDVLAD